MSGGLQSVEDGPARCVICGALAVGPCAGCARPVCGDCVELSEGGVKTWAVCLSCVKKGTGLGARWATVLGWIVVPMVVLVGVAVALVLLRR